MWWLDTVWYVLVAAQPNWWCIIAPRLICDDIRELLPMYRAPGNHVSTILDRICVALGKFEPRSADNRPAQIMLECGNSFEDVVADALARRHARDNPTRYIHGLEVERDGITGNIDLFDTEDFVVEEVKLTKLSLRHDIESEKFWHFWTRIRAYCAMVRSFTGRLHICHVMGNWSHDPEDEGYGWRYRVWEDTWTQRELEDTWRMINGHRDPSL